MPSPGALRITVAARGEAPPGEEVACDPRVKGRRFRHDAPLWNWHMRMWPSGLGSCLPSTLRRFDPGHPLAGSAPARGKKSSQRLRARACALIGRSSGMAPSPPGRG